MNEAILTQILQNQQEQSRVLGTLTGSMKSMEEVHNKNSVIIRELDNKIYGLDSWKNRLEKHITDEKEMALIEVNNRLKPLENHLEKVKDIEFSKDKMILESRLSLREKTILALISVFPTLVSGYLAIKYGITDLKN